MDIDGIRNNINVLENEIRYLGTLRIDYQNMNNQINRAISELSAAYNSMENAKNQLMQSYQSKTGSKKAIEFEQQATKINELISKLRDNILATSNIDIKSIDSKMEDRQGELSRKRVQLQEELNKRKSN